MHNGEIHPTKLSDNRRCNIGRAQIDAITLQRRINDRVAPIETRKCHTGFGTLNA